MRLLTICGVLVCAAGVLRAQAVMTQDGRALDANNRVGSGGVNEPYQYNRGFTSQDYITGQVTGLRSFRGQVGYVGQNELRITVPSSSTINDFQKQSVGLQDIYRGPTYMPSTYYDRGRTVVSSEGIAEGYNAPGTNVPITSYYTPAITQRVTSALGDFQRKVTSGESGDILNTEITPTPLPKTQQTISPAALSASQLKTIYDQANQQFANVPQRQKDRMELAKELQMLDEPQPESPAYVQQQVQAQVDESRSIDQTVREDVEGRVEAPAGPKNIDVDIFGSVLETLREQHIKSRQEKQKALQQKKEKSDEEFDRLLDLNKESSESQFDQADSFMKVNESGEIVLFTLAGGQDQTFNNLIKNAENFLSQGKYYAAANQYQLAQNVNPNNALTSIGLCQAYFAAGEPVTAAQYLEAGMRMFPALMVVKLDLKSAMTNQVLEDGLKNLDTMLQSQKDPSLALLSSYLYRSLNHKEKSVQSARLLKELAGEDEFYKQFAEYMITGRRPLYQN